MSKISITFFYVFRSCIHLFFCFPSFLLGLPSLPLLQSRIGVALCLIVFLLGKSSLSMFVHLSLELFLFLFVDPAVAESEEATHRRVDQAFQDAGSNLLVMNNVNEEINECLLCLFVLHGADSTTYKKLG